MESKVVLLRRWLINFTNRALRRLMFFPFTFFYAVFNAAIKVVELRRGHIVVRVGEVTGEAASLPRSVMLWLDRVVTRPLGYPYDVCLRLPREVADAHLHDVFSALLTFPGFRSVGLYWDSSSLADDLPLWQAKQGRNDPTVWATPYEDLGSPTSKQLEEFFQADHVGIVLPVAATRDAQTLLKRQAGGGLAVCLNLPPEAGSVVRRLATELPLLRFFELSPAGADEPGPPPNLVALHSWGFNLHERMALVSGADAYVGRLDELAAVAVMAGLPTVLVADAPGGQREARGGRVVWVSADSAALVQGLRGVLRLVRRRRKPDFLIIGAQRCGTTSLFHYLASHPRVAVPREKELHFFDLQYQKGFRWYVDCFAGTDARKNSRRVIRGEATPEYIFHPHAVARIKADLPEVKLIVLLRNPVDRAYSQYWHEVRLGYEPLSFEEAIAREPERLAGELERAELDANYNGRAMIHHSYLLRGIYADQLMRVFRHFPRSQVMLLRSEDLYADPQDVFGQVTDFLGIERQAIADPRNMTAVTEGTGDVRPPPMPAEVRRRLAGHFRAHNQRLCALVGRSFGWEEEG